MSIGAAERQLVAWSELFQKERDPGRREDLRAAYRLLHELWHRARRAGWRTLSG